MRFEFAKLISLKILQIQNAPKYSHIASHNF